jgi:uncharacterized RDD family membrane protein YckC
MTNENTKYDNVFRRIGASIIDILVLVPLAFLDIYICSVFENKFVILLWLFTMSSLILFYTVFLHYKYGQTLGKMATGIKVVDLNESIDITLKQSILRSITYILIETSGLIYFSILTLTSDESIINMIESFDHFGQIISFVLILLEIIVLFSNKKRMAFHDYIAKTVVVKLNFEEKT